MELAKVVEAKEVEMNHKLSEADTKSQKALLAKELEMQTKLRQANSSKMKAIEARDLEMQNKQTQAELSVMKAVSVKQLEMKRELNTMKAKHRKETAILIHKNKSLKNNNKSLKNNKVTVAASHVAKAKRVKEIHAHDLKVCQVYYYLQVYHYVCICC